jgi:hypothetical protein
MHRASESELDIAVFWIEFIDYITIGMSGAKRDLLPFNEINGTGDFFGTDFPKEVFVLSRRQDLRVIYNEKLFTSSPSPTASIPHASLSYESWAFDSALNVLQVVLPRLRLPSISSRSQPKLSGFNTEL